MKIVLLNNVDNLGERWQIVEVADGYARNVLIPQKLAEPATPNAIKHAEQMLNIQKSKAEEELKKTQDLASKIDGLELIIKAKSSAESGELYAAITPKQIKEALLKEKLNVPLSAIKTKEPVKKVGEHNIALSFDHGLEAQIKLVVESFDPAQDESPLAEE